MSFNYVLNWTDNDLKSPFVLTGKSVNTSSTSLRLAGKGTLNWGENFHENLLHLMENFASRGTPPTAPTIGQLWFNATTNSLNIQTASGWKELASRRIDSNAAPVGPNYPGDVWYDTVNNTFKVYTVAGNWVWVGSDSVDASTGMISDAIEEHDRLLQLQMPALTVQHAHNLKGGVRGSVPYQATTDSTVMLPPAADTLVLTMSNGLPVWAPPGAGAQVSNGATDGAGQIAYVYSLNAPAGYLKANGAAVSRNTYAELWQAMGSPNTGDGSTTFNLPDLRGEFIRGLDDGRSVDTNRVLGSAQADDFKGHTHSVPSGGAAASSIRYETSGAAYGAAQTTGSTGGTETRPRNIALLACVRYTAAGQVAGPAGPQGVVGPTGPAGPQGGVVNLVVGASRVLPPTGTNYGLGEQLGGIAGLETTGVPGELRLYYYSYYIQPPQYDTGP